MENARNIYMKYQTQFHRREPSANKGSYRKLLIAGGSEGMAGATYLSGLAAFRTGVGMVRYCGPSCNRVILQTLLPEAMYTSIDVSMNTATLANIMTAADAITANATATADVALSWADMLILGPGLSSSADALKMMEIFGTLLEEHHPELLLIDADGLNLIAEHHMEQRFYHGNKVIITPHVGEMARLTGSDIASIKREPVNTAAEYAVRHGITVVLKDCTTVIAGMDGRTAMMDSGSPALSKAGSGDVLTGTIAGAAAVLGAGNRRTEKNSRALFEAAAVGAYIHGTAGVRAAEQFGENGILASDIARCIGTI